MVDDVRRALPAMVRAFWDFPETLHLLPDPSRRKRVLPRYLSADMREAQRFDGLRVAERDGQVVGALAYLPPGAYPVPWTEQLRQLLALAPALPWAVSAALEGQRGRKANAAAHRAHGEPHYFIHTLGVDPSHQGKGIGSGLLRPVLGLADDDGAGCFLFTATAANAAWYNALGFVTEREYHPTPRWPKVWAMWRPPR